MEGKIHAKKWEGESPPDKILVIRLQALGDTVIVLPYLQGLKEQFPQCVIHFLTRVETRPIPASLTFIDKVFSLSGGRNAKCQFVAALILLPQLWKHRYDAVIDLQNNRITRIVTRLLNTRSWARFDLYSPASAGLRTLRTIESVWRWRLNPVFRFEHRQMGRANELLVSNGCNGNELIALNPAGFCDSRNWPLSYYVEFARQWLASVNPRTQFVLLLLPHLRHKADYFRKHLGDRCIDLTGKADQVDAFQILSRCSLIVSEDSGLMHMAWVQRIPTIALFSSSRKDWSAPQGEWSVCLDSSDLPCGPCGLEVCTYGDNRCITRYTPDVVLQKAMMVREIKALA